MESKRFRSNYDAAVNHMHVTDLPINRALGMRLTDGPAVHLLQMPESPLLLNHVGTIHASVQFALAEAASGEFLLRSLGEGQAKYFAVLRTSSVKFRKPAHGDLRAVTRFAEGSGDSIITDLPARGRALVSVLVEVIDPNNVITMNGEFDWFLQQQPNANPSPS